MSDILLYWADNESFLLRHVLTTILENPDIRLAVWRRPGDTEPAMPQREALMKLVMIALPGQVESEGEFMPERYFNAVRARLCRLKNVYLLSLKSGNQPTNKHDSSVKLTQPVWDLVQELSGDTLMEDRAEAVDGSPGGRREKSDGSPSTKSETSESSIVSAPKLAELEKVERFTSIVESIEKVESIGEAVDSNDATTHHRGLSNKMPAKRLANLEPGSKELVTVNTVTSSIKKANPIKKKATPNGVAPRTGRNKKRAPLDSDLFEDLEERKLFKAREHEITVINAKIRLVEAEIELAKLQGVYQSLSKGSVL